MSFALIGSATMTLGPELDWLVDGDGHVTSAGILSFVVGTGGKSLYLPGSAAPGTRYFRANRFGILMLSLGHGEFSWRYRTIDGGAYDPGIRSCS